ncbi:MAG: hypothetical protein Q9204_001820 [Flavoplaca sp. TL-2023a]
MPRRPIDENSCKALKKSPSTEQCSHPMWWTVEGRTKNPNALPIVNKLCTQHLKIWTKTPDKVKLIEEEQDSTNAYVDIEQVMDIDEEEHSSFVEVHEPASTKEDSMPHSAANALTHEQEQQRHHSANDDSGWSSVPLSTPYAQTHEYAPTREQEPQRHHSANHGPGSVDPHAFATLEESSWMKRMDTQQMTLVRDNEEIKRAVNLLAQNTGVDLQTIADRVLLSQNSIQECSAKVDSVKGKQDSGFHKVAAIGAKVQAIDVATHQDAQYQREALSSLTSKMDTLEKAVHKLQIQDHSASGSYKRQRAELLDRLKQQVSLNKPRLDPSLTDMVQKHVVYTETSDFTEKYGNYQPKGRLGSLDV